MVTPRDRGGPRYGSPYAYQVASEKSLKTPGKSLAIRDYLKSSRQGIPVGYRRTERMGEDVGGGDGPPAVVMDAGSCSTTPYTRFR